MERRQQSINFDFNPSLNNEQNISFSINLNGGGRGSGGHQRASQTADQSYRIPAYEAVQARNPIVAPRLLNGGASSSNRLMFPSTPTTTPTAFYNGSASRNSFLDDYLSGLSYLQEQGLPSLRIDSPRRRPTHNTVRANRLLLNPNILDPIATIYRTPGGFYFLRKILEEGNGDEIDTIITKVTDDLPVLMMHQTGGKFTAKVFESSNAQQMNRILESVVCRNDEYFINICNDYFGKQAVKALIVNLRTPEQEILVASVIRHNILSLTKFTNGHDVITCLICASHDIIKKLLFNEMAMKCIKIATDRVGCLILQRCIDPFIGNNVAYLLLSTIISNSPFLSEDPYGNYVVQHMLKLCIDGVTAAIVAELDGKFVDLATNKFGSNVVETCLTVSREEQVEMIIKELSSSGNFLSILQHPYGNYVIQSALQVSKKMDREIYEDLVVRIEAHSSLLHSHPYGKRVLHKIRGP